jgi:DNA-binding XRE family transcriptional regulator
MASFVNVPLYRRTGINQSLRGRWQGLPPHNYKVQGLNPSALPSDLSGIVHVVGQERSAASDVSSRFGRRLRELRLQRSLTQSEMARRFGIDRSFISDVERGRKSISLPMIEVIALGMNLSLAKLFEDL